MNRATITTNRKQNENNNIYIYIFITISISRNVRFFLKVTVVAENGNRNTQVC